jgi:hypothetical protein
VIDPSTWRVIGGADDVAGARSPSRTGVLAKAYRITTSSTCGGITNSAKGETLRERVGAMLWFGIRLTGF